MMLFLRTELLVHVVVIGLFLAGRLDLVSGDCRDPGTPTDSSRSVTSTGSRFGTGTVVKFLCNANYVRVGSKKIFCSSSGKWLGKIPVCRPKVSGCSMPPPSFAHAHIVTHPVSTTKGSYIYYSCDSGFFPSQSPARILCDKDRKSQDFIWSGVVSCQRIMCPLLQTPENGRVTYASLYYNSSWRYTGKAVYTCHQGYILRYRIYGETLYSTVLIRNCTRSGKWSSVAPVCVVKKCNRPANIENGLYTANNTILTIWTTVTFKCFSGFQLFGPESRQCLPSGVWTGQSNPFCQKVMCREPGAIAHGTHMPHEKIAYELGEEVRYQCNPGYLLWGKSNVVCKTVGDRSDWVPKDPGVDCTSSTTFDDLCQVPPECLLPVQFEDKCEKKSGHHLRFLGDELTCLSGDEPTRLSATTVSPLTSKSVGGELDKMTIVGATAGSTLGALLVLLTALVCVRRFHRSRRFSHSGLRRHRYSDDERIAIIAAYTGDVHFILPSYDEAMSQVERSPPSFDSVVQGQTQNNQQSANNNNHPLTDTARNANTEANTSAVVGPARIIEISSATIVHDDSTNENRTENAEGQSINLVSNPLAYSTMPSAAVENTAQSDGDNVASTECAETNDSLPLRRSESLQSSSSDDEVATSQRQPLLGRSGRGVVA